MANNYFRFKKFTVFQDRCAMKVCTDSCIFGACISDLLEKGEIHAENILDIGSGTGLLSLMAAQKSKAEIDAVEIDKNAFLQMKENFAGSPFSGSINAFHSDIRDFPQKKYDLIISNPPFFEGDLKSPRFASTLAKHDTGLLLKDLISEIKKRLNENGIFFLLVPFKREKEINRLFQKSGAFISGEIFLKHNQKRNPFRIIYQGSFSKTEAMNTSEIVIREGSNYTNPFIELLKDYYLNL